MGVQGNTMLVCAAVAWLLLASSPAVSAKGKDPVVRTKYGRGDVNYALGTSPTNIEICELESGHADELQWYRIWRKSVVSRSTEVNRPLVLSFSNINNSVNDYYECTAVVHGDPGKNITGKKVPAVGLTFVNAIDPLTIAFPGFDRRAIRSKGQTLKENCDAFSGSYTANVSTKWLKNGKLIGSVSHGIGTSFNSLDIDNLIASDAGVYTCVATTNAKCSQPSNRTILEDCLAYPLSRMVNVTVRYPLLVQYHKFDLGQYRFVSGSSPTNIQTCSLKSGEAHRLEWYHRNNDEVISRTTGALHPLSLSFVNISADQAGKYLCRGVFVDPFEDHISYPYQFQIDVVAKMRITTPGSVVSNITLFEGDQLVQNCTVTGDVEVGTSWTYPNGKFIRTPFSSTGISNIEMRITKMRAQDGGVYICMATTNTMCNNPNSLMWEYCYNPILHYVNVTVLPLPPTVQPTTFHQPKNPQTTTSQPTTPQTTTPQTTTTQTRTPQTTTTQTRTPQTTTTQTTFPQTTTPQRTTPRTTTPQTKTPLPTTPQTTTQTASTQATAPQTTSTQAMTSQTTTPQTTTPQTTTPQTTTPQSTTPQTTPQTTSTQTTTSQITNSQTTTPQTTTPQATTSQGTHIQATTAQHAIRSNQSSTSKHSTEQNATGLQTNTLRTTTPRQTAPDPSFPELTVQSATTMYPNTHDQVDQNQKTGEGTNDQPATTQQPQLAAAGSASSQALFIIVPCILVVLLLPLVAFMAYKWKNKELQSDKAMAGFSTMTNNGGHNKSSTYYQGAGQENVGECALSNKSSQGVCASLYYNGKAGNCNTAYFNQAGTRRHKPSCEITLDHYHNERMRNDAKSSTSQTQPQRNVAKMAASSGIHATEEQGNYCTLDDVIDDYEKLTADSIPNIDDTKMGLPYAGHYERSHDDFQKSTVVLDEPVSTDHSPPNASAGYECSHIDGLTFPSTGAYEEPNVACSAFCHEKRTTRVRPDTSTSEVYDNSPEA